MAKTKAQKRKDSQRRRQRSDSSPLFDSFGALSPSYNGARDLLYKMIAIYVISSLTALYIAYDSGVFSSISGDGSSFGFNKKKTTTIDPNLEKPSWTALLVDILTALAILVVVSVVLYIIFTRVFSDSAIGTQLTNFAYPKGMLDKINQVYTANPDENKFRQGLGMRELEKIGEDRIIDQNDWKKLSYMEKMQVLFEFRSAWIKMHFQLKTIKSVDSVGNKKTALEIADEQYEILNIMKNKLDKIALYIKEHTPPIIQ